MRCRFDLELELLEDLHTGTGTGDLIRDGILALDEQNRPIIDRHHFRGVLRDNGVRLAAILQSTPQPVVTSELVGRLFGKAGYDRRRLDCSSLRIVGDWRSLEWSSTARAIDGRQAEDHSLRTVEYLAAKTRLSGSIVLRDDVTDDEEEAIRAILRFTCRLGAKRSRGDGQFRVASLERVESAPLTMVEVPELQAETWYRLVFVNDEPLTFPRSGYAGNIIRSTSYVPGPALLGALAAIAGGQGRPPASLFGTGVSVGNALPLPATLADPLVAEVLPFPAHVHQVKLLPVPKPKPLTLPTWLKADEDCPPLDDGLHIDMLALDLAQKEEQENQESEYQFRRPKGERYLVRAGAEAPWQTFVQPLVTRMRNRRGDPRSPLPRQQTDLFSEQRIPAGTRFVADCLFGVGNQLDAWQQVLKSWSQESLLLGRGKAPCMLREVTEAPSAKERGRDPLKTADGRELYQLMLTLTSDWRVPCNTTLGDKQRLRYADLETLFDYGGEAPGHFNAYQDSEEHSTFNYASGAPRCPYPVIKRGSSFVFVSGRRVVIDGLKKAITANLAWGENQREGYGRYRLDLAVGASSLPKDTVARTEEKRPCLRYAEQLVKTYFEKLGLKIDEKDRELWRKVVRDAAELVANKHNMGPAVGWLFDRPDLKKLLVSGGENDIRKWFPQQFRDASNSLPPDCSNIDEFLHCLIVALSEFD